MQHSEVRRSHDVTASLIVVIPARRHMSVICDKDVEKRELNHDDDWLVMRYFECGRFVRGLQLGHTVFHLPSCSVGPGYKYIRSDGLVPEFMKPGVIET